MRGYVDEIIGDHCRVLLGMSEANEVCLPLSVLPSGVQEGCVVALPDSLVAQHLGIGSVLSTEGGVRADADRSEATVDPKATEAAVAGTRALLRRLSGNG